jgi:hypothetical protein
MSIRCNENQAGGIDTMMPQREADNLLHDQTESIYGSYEGEPATASQQYESSYDQPQNGSSAKVYPTPRDNKNMYYLAVFVIGLIVLLAFAFLAIFFIGGVGGWVSLISVAFIIFLMAAVVVEKIK